jgi:hypothetical protein
LLLRQHSAFTGANSCARKFRTLGKCHLGFLRQRTETHVRDKQRYSQFQRFVCVRPDNKIGLDRLFVEQGQLVQLPDNELQVFPLGQTVTRHAHGGRYEFDVWFIDRPGRILIDTLVGVTLKRLRMLKRPARDLIFINENLTILDPGVEFWQRLIIVVFADSCVDAIVPSMHTTNQISAIDSAIGHQCAPMRTASVQYANVIVISEHNQINVRN